MKIKNLGIYQDDDGHEYEVLKRTIQVRKNIQGIEHLLDGTSDYITDCGNHLNFIDGVLTLFTNGCILTSVD